MRDRILSKLGGRAAVCGTALLTLALTAGCYSHHVYSFPKVMVSGPGWTMYNGQVIWKATASVPELAGDLFVAVNTNGQAVMQFSKTLPFLTAQMDNSHWQVNIPSQGKNYSGGYPLPSHFGWLQIPALLRHQSLTSPWTLTGSLDSWEIRNAATGEYLRGYFSLP